MLGCQYSTAIALYRLVSLSTNYCSLFHMFLNDGSHQFPKSSQKLTFDSEQHVLQLEMKMDELPAFKKPLMLSITNCIAMLQVHCQHIHSQYIRVYSRYSVHWDLENAGFWCVAVAYWAYCLGLA